METMVLNTPFFLSFFSDTGNGSVTSRKSPRNTWSLSYSKLSPPHLFPASAVAKLFILGGSRGWG